MEYKILKSKVYILVDENSNVVNIDGGYTIDNVDDVSRWIFIDEGFGDKYNLCQSHYLDKPLFEEHGIPQYKYVNGKVQERTQKEIQDDIDAIPVPEPTPTMEELSEAITDIQMAMADTYEEDDNQLTDLQMAVAELYEMIMGGNENG